MSKADNPDYFINSIIQVIGNEDPKISNHLAHCRECKSVLTVSLRTAIQNMTKDPKIQQAMNIMAIHLNKLGA